MKKLMKAGVGLIATAAMVLSLGGVALAMGGQHAGTSGHQATKQHTGTPQHTATTERIGTTQRAVTPQHTGTSEHTSTTQHLRATEHTGTTQHNRTTEHTRATEHAGTTGQYQPAEQHGVFGDAAGAWYEHSAELMTKNRFMMGYTNGDLGGDDPINRGQFVAVMARMMNMASADHASFSDTQGHWAEGQIAAMVKAGIITGRADGSFGPIDHITRAQMATIMYRAHERLGLNCLTLDQDQLRERLGDVAGHWAEDHIAHLYSMGVSRGDSTGHFRPDDDTSRAQAAAILARWHEVR